MALVKSLILLMERFCGPLVAISLPQFGQGLSSLCLFFPFLYFPNNPPMVTWCTPGAVAETLEDHCFGQDAFLNDWRPVHLLLDPHLGQQILALLIHHRGK